MLSAPGGAGRSVASVGAAGRSGDASEDGRPGGVAEEMVGGGIDGPGVDDRGAEMAPEKKHSQEPRRGGKGRRGTAGDGQRRRRSQRWGAKGDGSRPESRGQYRAETGRYAPARE